VDPVVFRATLASTAAAVDGVNFLIEDNISCREDNTIKGDCTGLFANVKHPAPHRHVRARCGAPLVGSPLRVRVECPFN
jgi:hypothetical protein